MLAALISALFLAPVYYIIARQSEKAKRNIAPSKEVLDRLNEIADNPEMVKALAKDMLIVNEINSNEYWYIIEHYIDNAKPAVQDEPLYKQQKSYEDVVSMCNLLGSNTVGIKDALSKALSSGAISSEQYVELKAKYIQGMTDVEMPDVTTASSSQKETQTAETLEDRPAPSQTTQNQEQKPTVKSEAKEDTKTESQFDKDIDAHPTLSFIVWGFGPILWLVAVAMLFSKGNAALGAMLLIVVPLVVILWLNRNRIKAYFNNTDRTQDHYQEKTDGKVSAPVIERNQREKKFFLCSQEYFRMAEEVATIYYIVKRSHFIDSPSIAEILFATALIYFRDVKANNDVSDEKIVLSISNAREKHPTEKNQNLRTLIKKIEEIITAHNYEITNECINKNENEVARIVSKTVMNGENGILYSTLYNVVSSSLGKEEFCKKVSSYYSLENKYKKSNQPPKETVIKASFTDTFEHCVYSCLRAMKDYADTNVQQTKIAICSACYVICDYGFLRSGSNRVEKSIGLIQFIFDRIIPKNRTHEFDSLVNLYGRAIRGLVDVKNSWSISDCNMDNAITVVFCVLGDILFDEDNYYDYDSTPLKLHGFEDKFLWNSQYISNVLPNLNELALKAIKQ